jgi:hypothetical protein
VALNAFRVENEKAVRLASCDQVPPVMVIAGPNGVGKSTLLHSIHRRVNVSMDDGTQILYQPPHRAIRRQQVQRRFLGGAVRTMAEVFSQEQVSGFEGLQIPQPSRAPDNVDEAGSVLKFTLGRLENRRQNALATLVDEHSARRETFDTTTLPDVFEPIRRLTSRLLPHLAFDRIDFANEDNILCAFTRTDDVQTNRLDLDDLSSGEKAIFILFLPLIETEINARLNELTSGTALPEIPVAADRAFLIDETEQHLHPELQARLLGYMREEAARGSVQFLVTSHSPTLVDQAFDDELYVLGPARQDDANQLKRVASSAERLSTLRALTGNTFVVTTGRTIICLEGERTARDAATDLGLLQTLHPASSRYSFVPVGGKGNVIRVVKELRAELEQERLEISVAGIVDKDRTLAPGTEGIVRWPVCMIENLLLHAGTIAIVATRLKGESVDQATVDTHLTAEAQAQRADEIGVRVMEALGATTVRLRGASLEEIQAAITQAVERIQKTEEQISAAIATATTAVDAALEDGSFLDVFRGKELLKGLYRRLDLGDGTQTSFEQFTYALAQTLADEGTVVEIVDGVFAEVAASMQLVDRVAAEAEVPD